MRAFTPVSGVIFLGGERPHEDCNVVDVCQPQVFEGSLERVFFGGGPKAEKCSGGKDSPRRFLLKRV